MTDLKVGLIGLGGVCAAVHWPGLSRIPGVRISALCDADGELLGQRGLQWQVGRLYDDAVQMLDQGDLDAVAVATPNDAHPGLVEAALAAGCHVLCEKPLALNSELARGMYLKALASGLRHMTAFTYRFVPAMRYLRHLVQVGDLGAPRHARFQRLQDWGEGAIGWRQYRERAGTGELGDMGIHRIDLAEGLLGPLTHVTSSMRQLVARERTSSGEVCPAQDVEDWVAWIAETESGATAVFEMGKLSKGHGPYGDHDLAEINGSEASAAYQLHAPHQILFARRGDPYVSKPVPAEYLVQEGSPRDPLEGDPTVTFRYDQAWEFVQAIRDGRECQPSFYDGWRAQTVADTIFRAAEARRWLEVPTCPRDG